MKLMKHITIALVLCAIPAMAFGQVGTDGAAKTDVLCPEHQCHTAPYFQGDGGFVGMFNEDATTDGTAAADKITAVAYVATCGAVRTEGSVEPNADTGVVSLLFGDAGIACHSEMGGDLVIHGLMDGGWYWVHDETSSAASNLLPMTVLANPKVMVTDPDPPGDDPMTDPGGTNIMSVTRDYATFVKDLNTGVVGIIPRIVPTPPVAACGGTSNLNNNCELRASYSIMATTGEAAAAKDIGTTVTRDGADNVVIALTLGGSGFVKVDAAADVQATFDIDSPLSTDTVEVTTPGVTHSAAEITVTTESGGRCANTSPDRDTPVHVEITATASMNVVPPLATAGVSRTFMVVCPALPAANQGQELVPDNPFPVSE